MFFLNANAAVGFKESCIEFVNEIKNTAGINAGLDLNAFVVRESVLRFVIVLRVVRFLPRKPTRIVVVDMVGE